MKLVDELQIAFTSAFLFFKERLIYVSQSNKCIVGKVNFHKTYRFKIIRLIDDKTNRFKIALLLSYFNNIFLILSFHERKKW